MGRLHGLLRWHQAHFYAQAGGFFSRGSPCGNESFFHPKGFEDYKDGSLFAEFKVNNDEIWEEIKKGTFKGFSLAGVFENVETELSSQEDEEYNEIVELINKLKNKLK